MTSIIKYDSGAGGKEFCKAISFLYYVYYYSRPSNGIINILVVVGSGINLVGSHRRQEVYACE